MPHRVPTKFRDLTELQLANLMWTAFVIHQNVLLDENTWPSW
jgi:hypothetical protein